MSLRFPLVLALLAACERPQVEVNTGPADSTEYNRKALTAAVDEYVANGRTTQAFGELAQTVLKLRPGMDRTVAEEAELKLVVLALAPVKSVQAKTMAEQVDALALTVWPTLLSPVLPVDVVRAET